MKKTDKIRYNKGGDKMLSKEQISQIENDKNIFFCVVELLKVISMKGEVKVTFKFKDKKLKGRELWSDTIE